MSGTVFRTVTELKSLLAEQISARMDFLFSCQELVEALYSTGRLPGSAKEIVVGTKDDFIDDVDDHKKLRLDGAEYDGALKFRTKAGGWPVVDLAKLYKDPPAGYESFIDLGYQEDTDEENQTVWFRDYRVPNSLNATTDTIYALMKLRPPVLELDSLVPIRSVHAIKLGLIAIGLENESDSKNAEMFWQMCLREISGDKKEFDGIKKRTLSFRRDTVRPNRNFA